MSCGMQGNARSPAASSKSSVPCIQVAREQAVRITCGVQGRTSAVAAPLSCPYVATVHMCRYHGVCSKGCYAQWAGEGTLTLP